MHNIYLITSGSLVVYLVAAWAAGKFLGLSGSEFYVLFGILSAIGALGAAALIWWRMKQSSAAVAAPDSSAPEQTGPDEVDLLIRDADQKLSGARQARISNLPLIFVLGDQGTTKTSIVTNSGINAELLAGLERQDNQVAPTRSANLWFAGNAVLAEMSATVLADPTRWTRVIRRLRPGSLKSVVGGNAQAPRAALVCVSSEILTHPGAAESLANLSRNLHSRLGEISQHLGISFPVYVVFTKADRLPFFLDYVRTFTNEEANQVFGSTLAMRSSAGGIYADEETQRVTAAFNAVFHSLADHRIEFLPREQEVDKSAGAYEFPREFRKFRTPIVQFLVDLCRPSQLRTSPFLRGFYFCGVRPVVVQDAGVPAPPAQARRAEHAGSATGVFRVPSAAARPVPEPVYAGTKRVPQWMFLNRLFNQIILQDHAALSASGASTKTSTLQRFLLGAAASLCLAAAVAFTVSFLKNKALVNEAVAASKDLSSVQPAGEGGPALGDLERLDRLRTVLVKLNGYRQSGRPFSMGMGLYAGDDLQPVVRRDYYNRFSQLLFADAQGSLRTHMSKLPATPGPTDDYNLTYDILKGYLITTTHNNRVSSESPAPILLKRWMNLKGVSDGRVSVAQRQFEFYASDLKNGNPYASTGDTEAVEHARDHLNKFSGSEPVYRYMLSQAGSKTVNFNRDVTGSAAAVVNSKDVPAAFTKAGYDFMKNALRNTDKYFGGDQWVLERTRAESMDRGKLAAELSARYVKEFVEQWRAYFRSSRVLPYASLADAAQKLDLQTGTQSPILGLFWLASQHTGVDYSQIAGADAIQKAFQPVHRVVPPGNPDRYSSDKNAPYSNGLMGLHQAVDAAKAVPKPDAAAILSAAGTAKLAVKQMALEFNNDPDFKLNATAQKLLEDPITSAESLVQNMEPKELNGKGGAFCSTIDPVMRKFPFTPGASADASLAELNSILKPGEGLLWQFYQQNLAKGLVKLGTEYRPNGELPLNPVFVAWFNSMARLSEALYRSGGEPRLTYTVRPLKSDGIERLTMTIDGQSLDASAGQSKQFTWPGPSQGARLAGKVGSGEVATDELQGLWAGFRLFQSADLIEPAGGGSNLDWYLSFGRKNLTGPNTPTARFYVDLGPLNSVMRKAGLACVRTVAK